VICHKNDLLTKLGKNKKDVDKEDKEEGIFALTGMA